VGHPARPGRGVREDMVKHRAATKPCAKKKMVERANVGILQKNYFDKLDTWSEKEGTFGMLRLRILR